MGKNIFFKLLTICFTLCLAAKSQAFTCNVDGGPNIGSGNTTVSVNLTPVLQENENLVIDLSQHIKCWNNYGGWYDTDHINLVKGSSFGGSLTTFKGSLFWNNATYPFPLTTDTNVLLIGEKTPMPLPLRLYLTPIGNNPTGGVVIKPGEIIAYIHMYKISELGSGDPRHFTWTIKANNAVVIPTAGCDVSSRNLTVNLPDYPGSAGVPLTVHCGKNQKLSFYITGTTVGNGKNIFANLYSPQTLAAKGVGIQLLRDGQALSTNQSVSLGTVGKSPVNLGLSATYQKTDGQISAGNVQSIIGVNFTYD